MKCDRQWLSCEQPLQHQHSNQQQQMEAAADIHLDMCSSIPSCMDTSSSGSWHTCSWVTGRGGSRKSRQARSRSTLSTGLSAGSIISHAAVVSLMDQPSPQVVASGGMPAPQQCSWFASSGLSCFHARLGRQCSLRQHSNNQAHTLPPCFLPPTVLFRAVLRAVCCTMLCCAAPPRSAGGAV